MERREFLKKSCGFCLLGAAGTALPALMSGCATAKSGVYRTVITNNRVEIPLSLFDTGNIHYVRPKGWYYDIAVQRGADKSFSALLMKCTHMDNQLSASGSGFTCSLHGSTFDKDGMVKKGPAARALTHYPATILDNNLIIQLQA